MKKNCMFAFLFVLLLVFSFVGNAAAAQQDSVSRISCSMYGDGATGRGFCWYTQQLTGSDLDLIKSSDYSGSFAEAKHYAGNAVRYRNMYSHQVAVTDLRPGTAYTYRVGDREKNLWSAPCSFKTDDTDASFSFITIADVQASKPEYFLLSAQTMRAAMEHLPDAEFIVNLGDYVDKNTNEEWDDYFKNFTFANETTTGVPVAGNHDGFFTDKLNTNCFKNMFCVDRSVNRSLEGVYYSFDYGNAHFAVLNTNDMYPMSQAQKNWLVNDMTGTQATWKILLMHRSIYSAGKNINKPDTIIQRNMLLPVIDALDIDLVLSGHDHMYLRTGQMKGDKRVQNVEYVTERFGTKETTFAVQPEGTVFAMPSTAGQKRYAVNENAIRPILSAADVICSTKDLGGCFATVEIDGDRLVYHAYTVDDLTAEQTLLDTYAIKKTETTPQQATHLDQTLLSSIAAWPASFLAAIAGMLVSYGKLLAQVIETAVAK